MSDLQPVHDASMRESPGRRTPEQGNPGGPQVSIVTGARLHFGLLDTVDPFGGVGVMIDAPRTEVKVAPAEAFAYSGPQAARLEAIARRVATASAMGPALPRCRIEVHCDAPTHCGLGSGTQLAMAVAEGICRCLGVTYEPLHLATELADRGKRSAVGIHGYFAGGLIFEAAADAIVNPIQQRVELPPDWCVAVVMPRVSGGPVHGKDEVDKFASLPPTQPSISRELRRIASEELIPGAASRDFDAFASAVARYNHASGLLFAPIQGGAYNGVEISRLIDWLIERGVEGVGQSSWGPGVFAWFESLEHAEPIVTRLPAGVELITLTHPRNEGRELSLA